MRSRLWVVGAGLLLLASAETARADHPADASYYQGEARRQDLIARQLDLNYRMNWLHGYGPGLLDPFEPWPLVPGDIWGYPGPRPVEHPVGNFSGQVGPNHWIYRPLYAAEVAQPAALPAAVERGPAEIERPRPSDLDAAPAVRRAVPRPPVAHPPDTLPTKRPAGPRAF